MTASTVTGKGPGSAQRKIAYTPSTVSTGFTKVGSSGVLIPTEELSSTELVKTRGNLGIIEAPYYPLGKPRTASVRSVIGPGYGGFTDGRYLYIIANATSDTAAGKFCRFDLHDFSSTTILSLAGINSNYKDFAGGFIDGRYAYLMPWNDHPRLVRVDLNDFSTTASINLASVDSGLTYMLGACQVGRYGYSSNSVGYGDNPSGLFMRFSLDDFTTAGVTTLDVSSLIDGLPSLMPPVTDGRYVYCIVQSLKIDFAVTRQYLFVIDTNNFTLDGIQVVDLTDYDLGGQTAVVLNGYVYIIPYGYFNGTTTTYTGTLIRVNTEDLTDIRTLDLTQFHEEALGFYTGFTDSQRYLYLAPNEYAVVLRVDLKDFSTVEIDDETAYASNFPFGAGGSVSDGRYGYFIGSFGSPSGGIMRFQLFPGGNL